MCIGNVARYDPQANVYQRKARPEQKIDAAALIMALGRCMTASRRARCTRAAAFSSSDEDREYGPCGLPPGFATSATAAVWSKHVIQSALANVRAGALRARERLIFGIACRLGFVLRRKKQDRMARPSEAFRPFRNPCEEFGR